jgi:hypothetical protein
MLYNNKKSLTRICNVTQVRESNYMWMCVMFNE